MKKITLIAVITLLLDQIIKYIVATKMAVTETIHIIRNFFRITYLTNTGGAFSILSDNIIFLIIMTLIILGVIIYIIKKDSNKKSLSLITYGLLLGGIIGNFIDRIRLGYVVDYLDFNFGSYYFPVFNLADICIVISCIILIIRLIKEGE